MAKREFYSRKYPVIIGIMAHIDAGKTQRLNVFLIILAVSTNIGERPMKGLPKMTGWHKNNEAWNYDHFCGTLLLGWTIALYHDIDTRGHLTSTVEVGTFTSRIRCDCCITWCSVRWLNLKHWKQFGRQQTTYGVPRIVFVNKMD